MSEDSIYNTETVSETAPETQSSDNQFNSDYIALGLVGVFLLGFFVYLVRGGILD